MIRSKTTVLFLLSSLSLNLTAISYAIYRGINRGDFARYYKEGYFLTNVSTFHLVMISLFCFYIYSVRKRYLNKTFIKTKGKPFLWIILFLGFLYLAIDEQFMIHEYIDIYTHDLIEFLFNYKGNTITKRLDDFIVLLYLIFGVFILSKNKEEIIFFKEAKAYLIIGLILSLIMISIDISTSQNDVFRFIFPPENVRYMLKIFSVIEDSLKLFALTFFITALGECLSLAKKKMIINKPKNHSTID